MWAFLKKRLTSVNFCYIIFEKDCDEESSGAKWAQRVGGGCEPIQSSICEVHFRVASLKGFFLACPRLPLAVAQGLGSSALFPGGGRLGPIRASRISA